METIKKLVNQTDMSVCQFDINRLLLVNCRETDKLTCQFLQSFRPQYY